MDGVRRVRRKFHVPHESYMIQAVHGVRNEFELFQFECVACAMKKGQKFLYTIDVSLRRFDEYDYIIEANEGELQLNTGQKYVHITPECSGCAVESKWNMYEAIETMMGR